MIMWYSGEEDAMPLAIAKPSPLLAPVAYLVSRKGNCNLGELDKATAHR